MKNISLILLIIAQLNLVSYSQTKKRDLLPEAANFDKIKSTIVSAAAWHPFPTITDRDNWDTIDESKKKSIINEGERFINYEWKTIPASIALDFRRNGNRSRYENISFGKRGALSSLLFAELVENKGRFLDDISNGIWSICEESFWGASAHLSAQKAGNGLPDVTDPIVDLFAAETASLLSWTNYLLGDKLDQVSPLLRQRIKYEIERRIFKPYLSRNYGWLGFESKPNNWNPWINSNMLISTLFMQDDQSERIELINKIIVTLNNFINPYPDDGGCDEGPSYWNVAGGRLFTCLDYLYRCTNGKINIYNERVIKNIASYIYKMHIAGNYYFNTGDGAAAVNLDPALIFSMGKNINDGIMKSFGAYLNKQNQESAENYFFNAPVHLRLAALFEDREIETFDAKEALLRDFWLPQSQYAGARSNDGKKEGLYFAMQGGNNGESHNHNDVGNFVLYVNGQPAIIDIGVETYTAKTFSKDRYTIWTMQSDYHNLPNLNGFMQSAGSNFKASNISYEEENSFAEFKMDISKAYPKDAKVEKWIRSVRLNRNKNIVLAEDYKFSEFLTPLRLNFITCLQPIISEDGTVKFNSTDRFKNASLFMKYDNSKFEPSIEKIKIDDSKLHRVWGDYIYRVKLLSKENKLEDKIKIIFSQE